jgi:hypothetical protein
MFDGVSVHNIYLAFTDEKFVLPVTAASVYINTQLCDHVTLY